jgi:hypothetical protein
MLKKSHDAWSATSQPLIQTESEWPDNAQSKDVPYTQEELEAEVDRIRRAWRKYRRSRSRNGIYRFFTCIFELGTTWTKVGKATGRVNHAIILAGCTVPKSADLFSALITVASHPERVDRRTLAKWSRVLRYAANAKPTHVRFKRFVRQRGGVNGCATTATRRLRRKSKLAKEG